jgi:hypothetical protein
LNLNRKNRKPFTISNRVKSRQEIEEEGCQGEGCLMIEFMKVSNLRIHATMTTFEGFPALLSR